MSFVVPRFAASASSVAFAVVIGSAAPRALAVVTLNANFDQASLKSYTVAGTTAAPTVSLVGRDNYFGGNTWRWLNFRASDVLNARPTFKISENFAGGATELDTQSMVYSYDNVNWNFFQNNARSGGQFSFSNNAPFASNDVYVAYAPSYAYGRSVAHTQSVLATPWARPTASGNASGVIGRSPGGMDDLGRTVAPRDIYAYRLTNTTFDSSTRPKKKIVLSTGLHANETLGTYVYQGLIDFLTSNDPHAVVLRDVAEFYCYPMLNPDGRFAGNNRTTVENVNQDPNGLWNPTLWQNHADIRVNGQAMLADTAVTPGTGPGNGVDVSVDFHSTIPADPGDDFGFLEYEQGDNLAPFWTNFKALQPNVRDTDSTGTSWTTQNFAEAYLGSKVDVTFETQFGTQRPISFYTNTGRNLGLAFEQAFRPRRGDTNFDGVINFDDLLKLAQKYGMASGATWEDGDFGFDGDVDFADLLTLAQNYGTSGLGAAALLNAANASPTFRTDWALAMSLVPEPAVAAGLSGMCVVALRRARSR